MQVTNTILMIRPVSFRGNEQTAVNNYFQNKIGQKSSVTNAKALVEFDNFTELLTEKGINVIVVNDTLYPDTPDSIFPNNWISFHSNGTVGLYPMFAKNRRTERRLDVLEILKSKSFIISGIKDYTDAETNNQFLEGTGSLILDRTNKKAYCSLSDRANLDLFNLFCKDFEYSPVVFTANHSVDGKRMPIYHTNVMMCIGEKFSIICLESIDDETERDNVITQLRTGKKEIIDISEIQMHQFAGNMLQVSGRDNQQYLVMSSTAYNSLTTSQIKTIEKYCTIIHSSLKTIETFGGGSARCMMAEVFLPKVS